jgi:hypothetical protein
MKAFAAACVGSLALFGFAKTAAAATCSGRPTDASGYQGYAYGAAEVKSYATARARVHYATSGSHAPVLTSTRGDAVPDAVALAGDTAEEALSKYAAMGFSPPPSDVACTSNGGDDKLDIYLVAFAGADGATVPESCTGTKCASFVLCESTFLARGYATPREGFKTVITHELFHAVQNAYDQAMDRFWAEGSAQWAMKSVYPELADFERQLPAFFAEPARSLDTAPSGVTAGYLYGSAVWPLFLEKKVGEGTVLAIFEAQADGTKAIAATEKVLTSKQSSLADTFPLFWAWNVATKTYAGTGGYPDAAKYPAVKMAPLEDGVTAITSGLGAYAYLAKLDAAQKISIEADPARVAAVVVPLEGGKANLDKIQRLPADVQGDAIVVVTGITTKKTDAPFTLRLGGPDVPAVNPLPDESSSGDDGGCTAAPSRGTDGSGVLFVLLGLVLVRVRVRRR